MKITEKITSYDEFVAKYGNNWINASDPANHNHFAINPHVLGPHGTHTGGMLALRTGHSKANWWFVREALRFSHNTEIYGNVLQNIWNQGYLSAWCPRPHMADPTKIEFFPDAVAAAADRPIVTTMAKWLRKVSPLFTDEYIRDVDVAYRASQSTEIEIVFGKAEIRKVYMTGPGSCMSHDFHKREGYADIHPVDAYDTPGIGIAVGRDGAGRINARCMVYVNPDDANDKRMIRVYGDMSLEARLKRNKFDYRPFDGLRLNAYKSDFYTERSGLRVFGSVAYIAPFLDGVKGEHSSSEAARFVIKIEGEPYLRFVTHGVAQAVQQNANRIDRKYESAAVHGSPSSSGLVHLMEVPIEATLYTCPFSGATVNLLTEALGPTADLLHEGRVVPVRMTTELTNRFTGRAHYMGGAGTLLQMVLFDPAAAPAIFEHGGNTFVDNNHARAYCGMYRLDPEYYPDRQDEWVVAGDTDRYGYRRASPYTLQANGFAIANSDTVEIWDWVEGNDPFVLDPAMLYPHYGSQQVIVKRVHKSVLDKDAVVRVHSMKLGQAAYAAKRVVTVKTETGRTVVPGLHEVVQGPDGKWAFTRSSRTVNLFGTHLQVTNKMTPLAVRAMMVPGTPLFKTVLQSQLEDLSYRDSLMSTRGNRDGASWESRLWNYLAGRSGGGRGSATFHSTSATFEGYRGSYITMEQDLTAIREFLGSEDTEGTAMMKQAVRNFVAYYRAVRAEFIMNYQQWCNSNGVNRLNRYTMTCVASTTIPGSEDELPVAAVTPATPIAELTSMFTVAADAPVVLTAVEI